MTPIKTFTQPFEILFNKISALYGKSFIWSIIVVLGISLFVCVLVFTFFNSAAPTTLTIVSGPDGSIFRKTADKYKVILEKQGIKVKIIPSDGSSDNLDILMNPKIKVDVGFVQGGSLEEKANKPENLLSLGSISYQPLMIFYRGEPKTLISEFKGKRIDIGEDGSGTHSLAIALLKANGINTDDSKYLIEKYPGDAVRALLDNHIDAIFVMGDSASLELIQKLIKTPGIQLFNFVQADAYARRIKYLNKIQIPEGALDLGKNIPENDISLIAPTVELIARDTLHPALSDMLLEAAKEVHGTAGLTRKAGEFPSPVEHEFKISPDATRYYASGKSFLYRNFPFWMASLINRMLAVIVPIALLLIPSLRIAPAVYRWHMQSRIYPWYKALLELERDAFSAQADESKREALLKQLDYIEASVNKIKIPATFGDLFYGLRGHISFVRQRLLAEQQTVDT